MGARCGATHVTAIICARSTTAIGRCWASGVNKRISARLSVIAQQIIDVRLTESVLFLVLVKRHLHIEVRVGLTVLTVTSLACDVEIFVWHRLNL